MIITQIDFGTPAFDQLLYLRDKLLRKPLKLEFFEKDIAQEYDQIHFAAYSTDYSLLGCLTLQIISDQTVKMRQVVVDDIMQKKGVGQRLVDYSELWSRLEGYSLIKLHARDVAVPFYLKLNYNKVGKEFTEVNIKHWAMEKNL